jgi:hypothetical protein
VEEEKIQMQSRKARRKEDRKRRRMGMQLPAYLCCQHEGNLL